MSASALPTTEEDAGSEWLAPKFEQLVGTSQRMRALFALIARVAPTQTPILVQGETGTGKELVARALHGASARAEQPFVVVDCAALAESLLDDELFGHAIGAFPGASAERIGAIESADGGTVFLDEIGELPLAVQPKLLRVLESDTVRRIGDNVLRPVDVRFVASTRRDLAAMVNAGEFREDLYFRLSVIPVEVPPLRERTDDIPQLVEHFLKAAGADEHVGPRLLRDLPQRAWRGNVRELRNFVERARVLGADEALSFASGTFVSPTDAAPSSSANPIVAPSTDAPLFADDRALFEQAYREFREAWIEAGEREYVRRLLIRHQRNVTVAAREAGVDRTYVYRLMRKHEL